MNREQNVKRRSQLRRVAVGLALLTVVMTGLPASGPGQDQDFRLLNLERRLDQLQLRLETLERAQRSQALSGASSAGVSPEMLLELRRQQLALTEQLTLLQQRLLQLQKTVDQLSVPRASQEQNPKSSEKKEPLESDKKPKAPPRRP
jgi:hypothetical protein